MSTKKKAKSVVDGPEAGITVDSGGARANAGYTVLARRYRSREFDELVGQEAIAQTLRNAMTQGRVAHAYLFTGTRGVGKTSMARLLAKALNATDDLDERDAIAAAILRGDDMDVIEIDGASNRGIDNARDLIAGAGIAPARCRYKIYIIDEVHMLTTPAFNALLKTMEEPPSHVKFILCTTEPHKVPATIQSRCQRFDFRSIPAPRIAEHLRAVLKQEDVPFDEQAVMQVARLANGSMRDGLSLLDRLIAGVDGGESLDPALLERMLGLPDQSVVLGIFAAIAEGDPGAALVRTDALLQRGHSVEQAIETFVDHLRTLMLISACGADSDLIERSGDARDAAVAQSALFDAAGLVHMIALCEATARSVRVSAAGRALFDALVVRLSLSAQFGSVAALLESIAAGAPAASVSEKKKPLSDPEAPQRTLMPSASEAKPTPPPERAPARATLPSDSPSPAPPPPAEQSEVLDMAELWTAVLRVAQRNTRDGALVEELEPIALEGQTLSVRAEAEEPAMQRALLAAAPRVADLIQRAVGRTVRVVVELPTPSAQAIAPPPASMDEILRQPLVRAASELFDARVTGVRRAMGPEIDASDAGRSDGESDGSDGATNGAG